MKITLTYYHDKNIEFQELEKQLFILGAKTEIITSKPKNPYILPYNFVTELVIDIGDGKLEKITETADEFVKR
jgi:hypothetical protein